MGIQISSSQEYTVAKLGIGLRPQVRALSISRLRHTIAIIYYMKVGHGWTKKPARPWSCQPCRVLWPWGDNYSQLHFSTILSL